MEPPPTIARQPCARYQRDRARELAAARRVLAGSRGGAEGHDRPGSSSGRAVLGGLEDHVLDVVCVKLLKALAAMPNVQTGPYAFSTAREAWDEPAERPLVEVSRADGVLARFGPRSKAESGSGSVRGLSVGG